MVHQYFISRGWFIWLGAACLLLCGAAAQSGPADSERSDCEPELNAVFLIDGMYPGTDLDVRLLHIHPTGPLTYPDDAQLLNTIQTFYSEEPFGEEYNHVLVAESGPFRLYIAEPMDFGAATVIDTRDGTVVFAAGMVWMGFGETLRPVGSTHEWTWEAGVPAVAPEHTHLLVNPFWWDDGLSSQTYLAQVAQDHLRQTDVLRSFGSCAPYQMTTFLHTPTLGMLDPLVAVQVVIVTGHAGPPWGPEPVSTTSSSWGMVKSMYRR